MNTYIHYGHNGFSKRMFTDIKNPRCSCINKPTGGFWASAVDADFGWKDWNESEEYAVIDPDNSFTFILSDKAKKLVIDNTDILSDLPVTEDGTYDYEQLAREYDAIEVNLSACRSLKWIMYGWDCDSIVVTNPNVIKAVKAA